MEHFAVSTGAITVQQIGAQTGISAIDALSYVLTPTKQWLSVLNTSYYHHLHPSLLMSDIKGAFNCVVHSHFSTILAYLTFPAWMVKWVRDFNSNRSIAFSFDGRLYNPSLLILASRKDPPYQLLLLPFTLLQ